ncbi:retrovirus-related pol polyprotein from transposon TNT 1-94 [Tanacetum coccineum]
MKDKVVQNNSQVKLKKTEVEDYHRISSFSNNKTKFVTVCNDNLKSRTSNVNVVCATCRNCVFNLNHDACVSKFINHVNARPKKPKVVLISARKPKRQVNQSVATQHKKADASESPIQKSRSYFRMLNENTSKTWTRKHMTRNLKLLCNFVEKYMGTVWFGNDQFAQIIGYGDLVQGNIMIKRVYYVEGLDHNLFSVGQLCDANLEDQLCSSCELGKAKKSSFKTKTISSSKRRLHLLHMDLFGPMRVESINGKKYIMVIVYDYSRYTWTRFLKSKDETPEVLIDFLKLIQRGLQAQVITVCTDRGTKFLNKTLHAYFKDEGIDHQTSIARIPQQNGFVKRRNRTLVEAARTMLSASKLPLFFWAEAITTACYTHNM